MNKEQFLDLIKPGSRVDYNFCMKVYGYEITWPGYAEKVIARIEELGLSGIREYYDNCVFKYEEARKEDMKEVSEWYIKKCKDDWEKGVSNWDLKNTNQKKFTEKQKEDLLMKLQNRRQLI